MVWLVRFYYAIILVSMEVPNLITTRRDGVINILSHGVNEKSICFYVNAMQDYIYCQIMLTLILMMMNISMCLLLMMILIMNISFVYCV